MFLLHHFTLKTIWGASLCYSLLAKHALWPNQKKKVQMIYQCGISINPYQSVINNSTTLRCGMFCVFKG